MGKRGPKANGDATADPSGLRAAGTKLVERANKATQTRLDLGDAQVVFEMLEFEVGLEATELALKDQESSQKAAEAKRRETALDVLIAAQVTPEKAAIKSLRAEAEKLATESQERKHKVIRRTEVVYRPNTLSVHFFEPGSERKKVVKQERRMTDAEIKSFEAGGAPPPTTIPEADAPDSGPGGAP